MNKLHHPHRASGYIAKVDFQQTADRDGKADWIMFYQPGPKAGAEFRTFTKRGGPSVVEIEPLPPDPIPLFASREPTPLEAELIERGITPATAAVLVRQHDAERITTQIEILDWMEAKKPGKITDAAAWLVIAVKNGHAIPKGFEPKAVRQKREEARQAKERTEGENRRRKHEAAARERAESEAVAAYRKALTPDELSQHEAAAIAAASEETRRALDNPIMAKFRTTMLGKLTDEHIRQSLASREQIAAEG